MLGEKGLGHPEHKRSRDQVGGTQRTTFAVLDKHDRRGGGEMDEHPEKGETPVREAQLVGLARAPGSNKHQACGPLPGRSRCC